MPRQNFIARESFVEAAEKQTKDSLLSIPAFASHIRLLSENKMNESIRFLYERPLIPAHYHVDVSALPLNGEYTRISLHGRYANGQAFQDETDLVVVLIDFEAAFRAAMLGDTSLYQPQPPKPVHPKKLVQHTMSVAAALGMLFLRRNHG